MTDWILVDTPSVIYYSYYAAGLQDCLPLFLKVITNIRNQCVSDNMAFCFDSRKLKRKELYEQYKVRKKENEDKEKIYKLIGYVKSKLLKSLGFQNIFEQEGYEADDIIASIIHQYEKLRFVIVSNDSDMYQLLSDNVIMYNCKSRKFISSVAVKDKFGIGPENWALAVAISGCKSDNVHGIDGIGIKTACQYLSGSLRSYTKKKLIEDNHKKIIRNYRLVRLPYPGVKKIILRQDRINWRRLEAVGE